MTMHRDFNLNDPLPSAFMDAIQQFISTQASPTLLVSRAGDTGVQVVAGTGNDQVSIGLGGSMRFITSTVTATHPAGAAGTYNVWACAPVLNTSQEDAGTFDYAFTIQVLASGSTPTASGATALSRKVGETIWDGAKIVFVRTTVHGITGPEPGDLKMSASTAVPDGWKACNGDVLVRATYPALFAAIGTQHNTGGEAGTDFRLPNLVGRSPIGAGSFSGMTPRNVGDRTGAEAHSHGDGTLVAASHSHRHVSPVGLAAGAMRVIEPTDGALDALGAYNFNDVVGGVVAWSANTQIGGTIERYLVTSETAAPDVSGSTGSTSGYHPAVAVNVLIKT